MLIAKADKKYCQVLKLRPLAYQYRGKLQGIKEIKGNYRREGDQNLLRQREKPDEILSRQRSTICWAQPLQRQLSLRVIPTEVGIN